MSAQQLRLAKRRQRNAILTMIGVLWMFVGIELLLSIALKASGSMASSLVFLWLACALGLDALKETIRLLPQMPPRDEP